MKSLENMKMITEKPSFLELVAIHGQIRNVESCLVGLSDGGDTIQRATDLIVSARNLLLQVEKVCSHYDYDDDDDDDNDF